MDSLDPTKNVDNIINKHEHGLILEELKKIREDFKEVMTVTRREMFNQTKEINDVVKELREDLNEQKIQIAATTHISEGNRKAIYMVCAPALFVAISAMAKAMGFI